VDLFLTYSIGFLFSLLMANLFKANLTEILAYYLSQYSASNYFFLQTKLLELEAAQYTYLPSPAWMLKAGYTCPEVGTYLFARYGEAGVTYRIEVLSQTPLVLLFCGDYFLASQLIESDEQLGTFLQQHQLPIPVCV
jgi:hypothetical protein